MSWLFWLRVASAVLFTGIALGAFGAHGLKNVLSEPMKAVYQTGVQYHLIHGLAILALAWVSTKTEHGFVNAAGWLFLVGIFLFSGSLYLLSLTGIRIFGAITPLGGLAFLAGWTCLFFTKA